MIKKCNHCACDLESGVNWAASKEKNRNYTCRRCETLAVRIRRGRPNPPPKRKHIPGHCVRCGTTLTVDNWPSHKTKSNYMCRTCRAEEKRLRYAKKSKELIRSESRRQKEEIIAIYGGLCECCGENRLEFLSIDHVAKNGANHRKQIRTPLYGWLKRQGFPRDGYRVLCMNCNWSRGLYGYCPHKREQNGTAGAIDLASGTLRVSVWQH